MKDGVNEGVEGIKIACYFADMPENDLKAIMEEDYDLEPDKYLIGVFPEIGEILDGDESESFRVYVENDAKMD